ncbi:hypothetical protein BGW41_008377 [Actinomortierella wolfii]|nr:hypothetical protein BGW41_008377 [Actinomortierella wolfii]
MVKLTTLLLSGATILAMSATSAHAAVAFNSDSVVAFSGADDNSLIITSPLVARGVNNTESFPHIIDDGDDENEVEHLVRRASKSDKKKETKKPKAKALTKEQQTILDVHNSYRARHGAPPLTWNDKAAAWGNNHIQACRFQHSSGSGFGENLAAGYQSFSKAIKAWYDEEKKYNYNNPGFSGATGHFTQVVWKATKSVGCAKKFCPGSNWTIYICNYSPAGNIVGNNGEYFRKNVLPRRK